MVSLSSLVIKTNRYGNSFDYSYDAGGNRKVFKDHNNQLTSYIYDKLNRLTQMTNPTTGAFDWSYNSAGLPETLDYPNGSQANYTYDSANRIDVIDNKQSGVTVTQHDYDYDLNGNRIKLTESNIDAAQITSYEYDDADRLVKVYYPTTINSYTLDKVGNRELEVIDSGRTLTTMDYDYNNRDQLINITDNNGLDVSYDYDAAGNQTQKEENGQITSFDYSPCQRIKTITQNGVAFNYTYDHLGNRTSKESQGQKTEFTYDGISLLYETNTIGNVLAKYHYGSSRILAETRSGNNQYIFYDALSTPILITNQDGSIQNRVNYDAWGNQTDETATNDHPFGFTGYQQDKETDLYYAKARYYDAYTGRFLREDPQFGNTNQPPSLHRYLYAYTNPTIYIDPNGEAAYLFDGTGQDTNDPSTINPSNIGKLSTLVLGQSFYSDGVGTNDGFLGNLFGSLTGSGAKYRMDEAYKQMVKNFNGIGDKGQSIEPDRTIDLFGFSRGASIARIFANKINEVGIPDLSSAREVWVHDVTGQLVKQTVYDNYFKPEIRFMGLFDTVGSFGIAGNANEVGFDLSIAPNVKKVYHAVARDEGRGGFPLTSAIDPTNPHDPRIVEIMFEGVHSDIGGSFSDDDSLSHDALYWIYQSTKNSGVPVKNYPKKWLPILPVNAKPVIRERVVLNSGRDPGLEYTKITPQQGSRYNHMGAKGHPRQIIFKANKRPNDSDVPAWPFNSVIITMPQYEEFMRQVYDKPYWNVTEDYEAP